MKAKRLLVGLAALLLLVAAAFGWRMLPGREPAVAADPPGASAPAARDRGAELVAEAPAEVAAGADRALESTPDAEGAREAVEVSAPHPPPPPPAVAERATLVVRFVARETGAPVASERCLVHDASATEWSSASVDSADGEIDEAPISGEDGIVRFSLPPGSYLVSSATYGEHESRVTDLAAGELRELVLSVPTESDVPMHVLVLDDERGHALQGAVIDLAGLPESMKDARSSLLTGADGRALLPLPSWEFVRGIVRADGYAAVRFGCGRGHETPTDALALRLKRAAVVRGKVVDAANAPIQRARVRIEADPRVLDLMLEMAWRDDPSEAWSARTKSDGSFEIGELPPDADLHVRVAVRGYEVEQESLRLGAGEVRDVVYRIHDAARIRGIAVDEAGKPCADAELWLAAGVEPRMFASSDEHRAETRTAADGTFAFEEVPPGSWLVGPAGDSDQIPLSTHVDVPVGTKEVELVVRVSRGLFVSGRVVGPAGEPVPGVFVVAFTGTLQRDGDTDAEGAFRLGPFLDGELLIHVPFPPEGYAEQTPAEASAGDSGVMITLVTGGSVIVRVRTEQGLPVAAKFFAGSLDEPAERRRMHGGTTDDSGIGTLTGLAAGLYQVVARTEDGRAGLLPPVHVAAGVSTEIDVVVVPGGRLRMLRSPGAPDAWYAVLVAGVYVDMNGLPSEGAVSGPLPPGEVTVTVHGPGGETVSKRTVTIRAGETADVVFE